MGFKKRTKFNAEFNMSSLTDIIFLLLIFFMLTSTLTSPNAKNLDRPQSNSKTPSPQNIALSITADRKYFIESEEVSRGMLEERMLTRIREERAKNKQKGIGIEVTVVLNVEATENTGTIVDMMKMSNKLGTRLILATDPQKE